MGGGCLLLVPTPAGKERDASGTRLLSASPDGTLRLWDTQTGRESGRLLQNRTISASVAISSDGTRAVSIAAGDTAGSLWDLAAGKLTCRLPLPP